MGLIVRNDLPTFGNGLAIWLTREFLDGTGEVKETQVLKMPLIEEWVKVEKYSLLPHPTLLIPEYDLQQFLAQLEPFHKSINQHRVEAELEATKKHLEDLRSLINISAPSTLKLERVNKCQSC